MCRGGKQIEGQMRGRFEFCKGWPGNRGLVELGVGVSCMVCEERGRPQRRAHFSWDGNSRKTA